MPISDFPVYGIFSRWTTYGRLACLHCQDNTDAFWLQNENKSYWFDCHWRFLPSNHLFHCNRRLFTRNKVVRDGPLLSYDGNYLLEQYSDFYVVEFAICGGPGHDRMTGYGVQHS